MARLGSLLLCMTLLMLPGFSRAESGVPDAGPWAALHLVTLAIPNNGVLLFGTDYPPAQVQLTVKNKGGVVTPGELIQVARGYLAFRPTSGWSETVYDVDATVSSGQLPYRVSITVADAATAPLPSLEVTATVLDNNMPRKTCCYRSLERTEANRTDCTYVATPPALIVRATPKGTPDASLYGQVLWIYEADGVEQKPSDKLGALEVNAPINGSQRCVMLKALDLRTGTSSQGAKQCGSPTYDTKVSDLDTFLSASSCPVPDLVDASAWCSLNEKACRSGACTWYAVVCNALPTGTSGSDAGASVAQGNQAPGNGSTDNNTSAAPKDAGPDDVGEAPKISTTCAIHASARQPVWGVSVLLAMAALLRVRSKRVRARKTA